MPFEEIPNPIPRSARCQATLLKEEEICSPPARIGLHVGLFRRRLGDLQAVSRIRFHILSRRHAPPSTLPVR